MALGETNEPENIDMFTMQHCVCLRMFYQREWRVNWSDKGDLMEMLSTRAATNSFVMCIKWMNYWYVLILCKWTILYECAECAKKLWTVYFRIFKKTIISTSIQHTVLFPDRNKFLGWTQMGSVLFVFTTITIEENPKDEFFQWFQ